MAELRYTKNLFLRCMNAIYLFAFASLYIQIPGLYGNNGILPARTQLDLEEKDFAAKLQSKPTLLWFAPYLGLDTEFMMDVLALIGIFFSFTGFVTQKFCTKSTFTALWSLYYSLYQVGQTFMWFQWDDLLLETGFLCILMAPLRQTSGRSGGSSSSSKKSSGAGSGGGEGAPTDQLSLWLARWLLFRVIFSTGILKLLSGCPTWWGLSALTVHFESMCLPTPLAWYAHHLPQWFLKLNVVFANFAEIFLPPLFFFPLRGVRIIAFIIEVFLQIAIVLTGNYNFHNYLIIVLCLSLVDDEFFTKSFKKTSLPTKLFKTALTIGVYGGLLYAIVVLYGLKLQPGGVIESKIMFTSKQFDETLARTFPALIAFGLVALSLAALKAITISVTTPSSSTFNKIFTILTTLFYVILSACLFADSLVPFSTLHPAGNKTVPAEVREWHTKLSGLRLTNSYGLFRRMTGVGGRPEVVIEGSDSLSGPWSEYQFKYKPGDLNRSLPFVAPHTPRLDWQMWFAALGTYHQNPWLMSLTYRLLTGQSEVLKLLATEQPFTRPPKYLRGSLYHYHYVPWSQKDAVATWKRERVGEYFPNFSKDHPPLLDYLKNLKILTQDKKKESPVNPLLIKYLNLVREVVGTMEPAQLMAGLLLSGLLVILASSYLFRKSPSSHKPSQHQPQQQQQKKTNQRRKNAH